MPSPRTLLFAAALMPAAAAAEVYRCESGGVVRYTDQPCARGAQPLALPDPIVVPAGPSVDLIEQARERDAAAKAARERGDAQWAEQHAERSAREERIRNGRVRGEVVEGMAPADVRRIHGEPAVVSRSSSTKGPRETWSYVLGDGRRLHVTFTAGTVSGVRTREEKR